MTEDDTAEDDMAGDVDHVLLTRFNLPSPGFESLIRAKEGWLRNRVMLFERHCIPSVQAQTKQAFRWIIYFDPASPEWLKHRIQAHADAKLYVPIFRPSVSVDELVQDIRSVTGRATGRLITTNLDNDDALAAGFVERLQESAPRHGRTAIYLVHGLIKREPYLYLRRDRVNAFASVAEDSASPSTCWSDWHNLLGKHMPTLELHDEPGWLQVVHGRNVSNRVRGRLVSPASYAQLFPGLLDDVRAPGPLKLGIDIFADRPRRIARDYERIIAKKIAMRVLGKHSLDRVKVLLASRSVRYKLQRNEPAPPDLWRA